MKISTLVLCALAVLTMTGCQQKRPNEVPKDWVATSNNERTATNSDDSSDAADALSTPAPELGETVDQIFTTQGKSLERAEATNLTEKRQGWHMTAFMTDLGISMSGFLGALIYKGTPGVTAIFRKQYSKPEPKTEEAAGSILVSSTMNKQDLNAALEPSIQATLATGRVQDEQKFRTEAYGAAQEFQTMTRALDTLGDDHPWKVSRFRLDLSVDVSGKITPVISVGGDVRLRFEWFKMKRPTQAQALTEMAATLAQDELSQNLAQFAAGISEDLIELSDDSVMAGSGFKAYSYRVGLGISKKKKFGVITDTNSLLGHLYFSRNIPKPIVNPKPTPSPSADSTADLALIDQTDQVTPITHKRFRKGLNRALKMGAFFAHYANRHPGAKWKVYELRTSFDLSLTGKTSISGVSGLGATEINFYNERF